MAGELAGQVAIVTGGGRGIGRAIAQRLSAGGAAVAVTARTTPEIDETAALIESAGGKALALTGDVTSIDSLQAVVAETERRLGPVDLLVNNAGAPGAIGPAWEVDLDGWRRCLEVNLVGPFLGARAVLPGMIARGRGRIVNIASGAALRPTPYDTAYGVSKTGLLRLTEALAAEAEPHGVKVFVMAPGTVRTRLQDPVIDSPEGKKWLPDWGANFMARAHGADLPAELCFLLASGRADALSGRFVNVNQDVEDLADRAEELREKGALTLQLRLPE